MSAPKNMISTVWNDIKAVRETSPLVVNITNYVVTNNTANATLALGASPAMNHVANDLPGLVNLAGALVINLGTIPPDYIEGMHIASTIAQEKGIPIVIDPVAAGINDLRTNLPRELLDKYRVTMLRGNASEVMAVAGAESKPKGVDTANGVEEAADAARIINKKFGCAILVSGETDLVVYNGKEARLCGGSSMMTMVTGLGCTCSAVGGVMTAVQKDPFQAAIDTAAIMNIAGEMAAEVASGPGSLQLHFLDALYQINEDVVAKRLKVELS